eukprot:m.448241 g.448241  ORF g.448241 m.448241 type:complete len:623 (-) comp19633_c0_seq1:148-2016(-)
MFRKKSSGSRGSTSPGADGPAPPPRNVDGRGRGRGRPAQPAPIPDYNGGSGSYAEGFGFGAQPEYAAPEYAAPDQDKPPEPPARRTSAAAGRPETQEAKVQMATPGHEFDRWQLNRGEIKKGEQVGSGNFGAVFKGTYRDTAGVVVPVTQKTLHNVVSQDKSELGPRRLFIFEASILMELQHPNVLFLIGVCTRDTPWIMVTEYLEYGDLRQVLENLNKSRIELTLAEHIHVSQNVAAGMLYLASKQFIHRDLRARNCFVSITDNGDTVVKIADFGMSSVFVDADNYAVGDNPVDHAIRWMAPESMKSLKFTLRSDVWSFGMVLYEIFTYGGVPFQGVPESGLRAHVLAKKTPPIPKNCTSKIVSRLMEATWAIDPKRRPDVFEITTKLSESQVTALRENPKIRDVGKLAAGSAVSPYAALDVAHAQYASSDQLAGGAYAGLSGNHATYATTPAGMAERELYGHIISVDEDGTKYARRPLDGPGSIGGVAASSTYEALEADRQVYASTNGLGSSYKVPGLNPNALYYHGVCSRPIAERALLSQGPVETLDGTFLVRQSPRGQGSMVISMVFDGVVWHYKMNRTASGYEYYGKHFRDIDEIIEHHKKRPEAMLCCLENHCSRF